MDAPFITNQERTYDYGCSKQSHHLCDHQGRSSRAPRREACADLGINNAIAVTDPSGHLKAFISMDGTPFLAHDLAINKAWTAVSFRRPTHAWVATLAAPATAHLAHTPRVVAVGGGYPIIEKGHIIGGLGVSGGEVEQDQHAAETALTALGFDLPA